MKTWKRALALVLALVMALSLVALPSFAEGDDGRDKYNVIINYVFADGQTAAPSWTATIAAGSDLDRTVTSPAVVGYTADQAEVHVDVKNIQKDKIYTVTYNPAEVEFTVKHYWQNLNDDEYTLHETVSKKGLTKSPVGAGLAKTYEGFTALLYDTTTEIAADGSTVVEIKYDRNYFLLGLDLAGGWGAEPIYARYGTPVKVTDPTKPGYTFGGWNPALPGTITGDSTHVAQWNAGTANYTVQYWQENADDDGYSLARKSNNPDEPDVEIKTGTVGTKVSGSDARRYEGFTYNGGKTDTNVEIKGDGSTVVNVYYKRNVYTVNFYNRSEEEYTQLRITAKYGANINAKWPTYSNSSTWIVDNGSWSRGPYQANIFTMPLGGAKFYGPKTSRDSESASYYVQVLPGETGTETKNGVSYKIDHTDVTAGSGFSVTSEDQYEMTGYTFNASDSTKTGKDYDGAKFYYTRNQYNLTFNDNYGGTVTDTLYYQQPLNASAHYQAGYEPDYPAALPVGAYTFGGWYKDPGCTDPVDWNSTMPAQNQVVYAKWTPVVFQVTYAKNENETPEHQESVNYGELAKGYTTDNGLYTFVGWFYRDADGTEHAFDPTSMPVTKNMALYAKWRSNVLVPYTIHYQLEDGTTIAPDTTGSALAGTTKTFNAKAGTELNGGYQTGYFPQVSSHSITMDINGNNVFTFVYVQRDKVPYTVKYLDKATGEPVANEKHNETSSAIITENAVYVPNYVPERSSQRLVLSANESENVLIFYYVKDTVNTLVTVRYWQQNAEGGGYTMIEETTETVAKGRPYTAEKKEYDGFAYERAAAEVNGSVEKEYTAAEDVTYTVPEDGLLVLNLYYVRQMYSYEFRFVDDLTGNSAAPSVTGSARFGSVVPQQYKNLEADGYVLADGQAENAQITITKENDKNVYTFHYMSFFNVVHVQNGTNGETKRVVMNSSHLELALGGFSLTDLVPDGYLYGGAFEADHTTPIDFANGQSGLRFVPDRGVTYYIWEVSDDYLHPFYYRIWKPVEGGNGGEQTVSHLYMMAPLDRLLYSAAGFTLENGKNTVDYPVQKHGTDVAYGTVQVDKMNQFYQRVYVCEENGQVKIKSTTNENFTDYKPGYIAFTEINANDFGALKDSKTIKYTPYWVTLDGVKVTSVDTKECSYTGGSTINTKNIPHKSEMTFNAGEATTLVAMSFVPVLTVGDTDKDQITVTIHENGDVRTVDVQPGDLTGELAYTEVAGKLFAGFFQDEACTVPADFSDVQEDITVYAKYVSDSYLQVKYTEKGLFRVTGVNLFSAVSSGRDFAEVGILVNDQPIDTRCASRYLIFQTARTMFGLRKSDQLVIGEYSLRNADNGTQLVVTPYWVTLDGTTVTGTQRTLAYTTRGIRG